MNFMTLIYILFVIAGFSLVYWALMQFTLPQPLKVILIVVMGLIGLAILWNLLAGGTGHFALRGP